MDPSTLLIAEVGAMVLIAVGGTAALVLREWRATRSGAPAAVEGLSLPVVVFCPGRDTHAAIRLGLRDPAPRTRFRVLECEHFTASAITCDRACVETAIRA